MIRKTIQTGAIALGLLGVSAMAGEGASFSAGGTFLMARPAMSETGMGAGVNFDVHFPVKSVRGLELGMRSFLAQVTWDDYVNLDTNGIAEDLDRDFYYAGVAFGPLQVRRQNVFPWHSWFAHYCKLCNQYGLS